MKVAVQNGVFSGNAISTPDPPFICPSGNCTWDSYSTLGVDVQCSDISSTIRINCSEECGFEAQNDGTIFDMINNMLDSSGRQRNISGVLKSFVVQSSAPSLRDLPVLKAFANVTGFLAYVQWVKATNASVLQGLEPNSTYEAMRCGLYLAVKEVKSSVLNGVCSEQTVQEWTYAEHNPSTSDEGVLGTALRNVNGTIFNIQQVSGPGPGPDNIYKPPFALSQRHLASRTFTVPYFAWYCLSSQLFSTQLFERLDNSSYRLRYRRDGYRGITTLSLERDQNHVQPRGLYHYCHASQCITASAAKVSKQVAHGARAVNFRLLLGPATIRHSQMGITCSAGLASRPRNCVSMCSVL